MNEPLLGLSWEDAVAAAPPRDALTPAERTNIITMFKKGQTKVPLNIISRLAAAVGADPSHLLLLALEEYDPDLLAVIQDIIAKGSIVTMDESVVLERVRTARGGRRIDMSQTWALRMLQDTVDNVDQSQFKYLANFDLLARRNLNQVYLEIEKENF